MDDVTIEPEDDAGAEESPQVVDLSTDDSVDDFSTNTDESVHVQVHVEAPETEPVKENYVTREDIERLERRLDSIVELLTVKAEPEVEEAVEEEAEEEEVEEEELNETKEVKTFQHPPRKRVFWKIY